MTEPYTAPAPTRRSFYIAIINTLGALIAAALAIPAAAYLLIKPRGESSQTWVEVADLAELRVGKPEEILYQRTRMDGWRRVIEKSTTWVVRTDQTNVVAFTPACTHLGCAYHWEEFDHSFICPCHSSVFGVDGKVISGPAPRSLDRYAAKVEGRRVLVGSDIHRSDEIQGKA